MSHCINYEQDEIIKEFSQLSDWLETYHYLITLGKKIKPLDEQYKTEENMLNGCQSSVWIAMSQENEILTFAIDSDSLIIKGILSLLLRVLNNKPADEIASADLYFIEKIGLPTHLSPARVDGLMAIINHIKTSANMASSEKIKHH